MPPEALAALVAEVKEGHFDVPLHEPTAFYERFVDPETQEILHRPCAPKRVCNCGVIECPCARLADEVEGLEARLAYKQKLIDGMEQIGREVLKREEVLRNFISEGAAEECSYGDGCPNNAGTRHGRCQSCKAREALARAEEKKDELEAKCSIMEYDGSWSCFTHHRSWGAILGAVEPCPGWQA